MKGNGKNGVILWEHEIADFQFNKTDAAVEKLGLRSTSIKAGACRSLMATACKRSAAEGIQYAAFHFWLQMHVGKTCAIALLFMSPSDLPRADYRKLPANPKMQRISIRSSSLLPLKLIQWYDEMRAPVESCHNCVMNRSVSTRTKLLTPTQRGDPEDQD